MDEGDSDPIRFLLTLAHGLSQADPRISNEIGLAPTSSSIPDQDALLSRILEALDKLPCQMVTVLDDCGLLASPQVRRMAYRFLSAVPHRAHFILLTRDPSFLPMSRWRLRQEVLEFGPQDLALNEEEFERWMKERIGIQLHSKMHGRLHGLFEGWFAALQLLALKLDREANRQEALENIDPCHPYLFQYLLEEVLRDLPPEWRRFLLETSILKTLHPTLCDEVRQAGNSAHLLQFFYQANLFLVPLTQGSGYRYHRLFGESLQGLLEQWDPDEVPNLHRRAARWHMRHGSLEATLEHALSAKDGDTLELLAGRALENIFRNSEFSTLHRHIQRIPKELCSGRPWLSIFSAWALFHIGKEKEGEARLKEAERILLLEGKPEIASRPLLRTQWAHIFLLKGILDRLDGSNSKALTWIRQAQALVPDHAFFLITSISAQTSVLLFLQGELGKAEMALDQTIVLAEKAGHHLAYFGAVYTLCEILGMQGRSDDLFQLLETTKKHAEELPDSGGPAFGYWHIAKARALRMTGEASEAMMETTAGIATGLSGGNIRILNYGYATKALLLNDAGDSETALKDLEKAESFGIRNRMHWAVDTDDLRAMRIRCLGPQREMASSEAWMARERSELNRPTWSSIDRCRTACAWLEWNGDRSGSARLAKIWADHAEVAGWLWVAREFRLIAEKAFGLRENAGQTKDVFSQTTSQDLSEREVEVLRAMREGKSNKEIAGALFVAPSTVKTHLKNIYQKLEVNNRLLAVTRAVDSGIL